jgi:UDP-N-acetylglucosamine transferase subunit ALG13
MHKKILYCVLDWGLGHATRSIPIIRSLLDKGHEVILASDSLALDYLRKEFPSLSSYELPSYDVKYRSTSLLLVGIQNIKGIRQTIRAEHELISRIAKKEIIDAIVSDNRYGCYVPGIPSVLVTHQLQFRTGSSIQDRIGRRMMQKLTRPFDHIWVPDDEERTLSGVLSKSGDTRISCIGPQSTLTRINREGQIDHNDTGAGQFTLAAILSGPEPMRTEFETAVRQQLAQLESHCALVRGVHGKSDPFVEEGVTIYDVLDRKSINRLMNNSSIILCRSGYSSLMDLNALGKRAILIPTPGQPEQKYLGQRMQLLPNYVVQAQKKLNIKSGIDQLGESRSAGGINSTTELLDNAIRKLLNPY